MSTIEDQLRAAGRAVAEQVTALPELQLTTARPRRRAGSPGRRRAWATWGAPLAAMGLVAAVAIALVVVKGAGTGTAGPAVSPTFPSVQGTPPSAAQVPAYYIAGDLSSGQAVIGDLRSGQQVATITPPAGHTLSGVTGAADGGSFVLDMPPKGSADTMYADHQFFLYRPASPGGAPLRRSPLTLTPSMNGEAILGLSLSPDGRRLAVYSMASYEEVLRVYSVATGQVQRQWTMPTPSHVYYGGDENSHSLTWTDNGQAVAFRRDINLAGGEVGISVFVLTVDRPGTSIQADSRVFKVQSTDNQCKDLVVSPDGTTVICGVESGGGASASCPAVRPGITEYSAVTGKLIRVLYAYPGDCAWGMVHVYWTSPSGSAVVASLLVGLSRSGPNRTGPGQPQYVNAMDLFGARGFTAVPLHLPAAPAGASAAQAEVIGVTTLANSLNPVAF